MNISPFLDKKLARRFKTYDYDGNHYIERTDFEQSAAKLCAEFGHAPDSPARQRLDTLYSQLWERLVTATGSSQDNRISEAEYKQAFVNGLLVTPENFEQLYIPFNQAIIAIIDTNGDGKISLEEDVRWKKAIMNMSEPVIREVFPRIDRDGDGYITADEFLEAARQFYFNDDPQSIGSWLFGPLDA